MSPSLVVSLIVGSICGLLGHAVLGQRPGQIPLYWGMGVAGFFAGSILAALTGGALLRLGPVPLLESTTTAILSVLILSALQYTRPRGHVRQAERTAAGGRRLGERD